MLTNALRSRLLWLSAVGLLALVGLGIPLVPATTSAYEPGWILTSTVASDNDGANARGGIPAVSQPTRGASYEELGLNDVQGDITLQVSLPHSVRAGDYITYTFTYQNTTKGDIEAVRIEARWGKFALQRSTDLQIWQYCDDETTCDVIPETVRGNPVERRGAIRIDEGSIGVATFQLEGTVKAGQGGSFQVRLRSNPATFPKTGVDIVSPYGSGLLYVGGSGTPMSKDTNTTTVKGPVFLIEKTAVSQDPIFPLDTVTFKIVVGNATGSKDTNESGVIRADAIAATDITVSDTFPESSEFVAASGIHRVEGNTVIWSIPGPLEPGKTTEVEVTYRKLDVDNICTSFVNTAGSYSVTSPQLPLDSEGVRYQVSTPAPAAAVPVAAPIVLSIAPGEQTILYGDTTTINVSVQNVYREAVRAGRLEYQLPANVYYHPNCPECPKPIEAPSGKEPGGKVVWSLDGLKARETKTFTVRVRGAYVSSTQPGTAAVTGLQGVPGACVKSVTGGAVTLRPRLFIAKAATSEASRKVGTVHVVNRHEPFGYTITIENQGSTDAVGVTVTDMLPGEAEKRACFTYVPGSNGSSPPPSVVPATKVDCGKLVWENLTIPANRSVQLTYAARVDGHYYTAISRGGYCNQAVAARGDEVVAVAEGKSGRVCVAMEPEIVVTKASSKSPDEVAQFGEEIIFTLAIENRGAISYTVGLYDIIGDFTVVDASGDWEYVGNNLQWAMETLGPGMKREHTLRARVPDRCFPETVKKYVNEAAFRIHSLGEVRYIVFEPRVLSSVTVAQPTYCIPTPTHTFTPDPTPTLPTPTTVVPTDTPPPEPLSKIIEYSKRADRTEASLYNEVIYTITIRNTCNITGVKDVRVWDLLPKGFTFSHVHQDTHIPGLEMKREITALGEEELTWEIPLIEKSSSVDIVYVARTSRTITSEPSMVSVAPIKDWEVKVMPGGQDTVRIDVRPLIDLVPSIPEGAADCYRPGDIINYEVKMVNNDRLTTYEDTTVVITLPRGLEFIRSTSPVEKPFPEPAAHGYTTVTWKPLVIAKREGTSAVQKIFRVEARVGSVYGSLGLDVYANSRSGMIPKKEHIAPVVLAMCPPPEGQVDVKKSGSPTAYPGGRATYVIQLVNMNQYETEVISVTDTFQNRELIESVIVHDGVPSPVYSDDLRQMSWSHLTIPAARMSGGKLSPGILELAYDVQVNTGRALIGRKLKNTVRVQWAPEFQNQNAEATVETEIINPPKNTVYYTAQADRIVVGQGNTVSVTLKLQNFHPEENATVQVSMVIPEGFRLVTSLMNGKHLAAQPRSLETGETLLTWNIPDLTPCDTLTLCHTLALSLLAGKKTGTATIKIQDVLLPEDTHPYWVALVSEGGKREVTIDVQQLIDIAASLSIPSRCVESGVTVDYQLDIENRNPVVDYNVVIAVELPIGIYYAGQPAEEPMISLTPSGKTRLLWSHLTIARASGGTQPTRKTLTVPLKGGDAWGRLNIRYFATSREGEIASRAGTATISPIEICPPSENAVGKEGAYLGVTLHSKPVYKITILNTKPQTATKVKVIDVLPDILEPFGNPERVVQMVADDETVYTDTASIAPVIEGNGPYTATWTVDVPGASGKTPGLLVLKYQVDLDSRKAEEGRTYTNQVKVVWPEGYDPAESKDEFGIPVVSPPSSIRWLYLPVITR